MWSGRRRLFELRLPAHAVWCDVESGDSIATHLKVRLLLVSGSLSNKSKAVELPSWSQAKSNYNLQVTIPSAKIGQCARRAISHYTHSHAIRHTRIPFRSAHLFNAYSCFLIKLNALSLIFKVLHFVWVFNREMCIQNVFFLSFFSSFSFVIWKVWREYGHTNLPVWTPS